MIKLIYNWLMTGEPIPHLFAGERLVSDVPFQPKKQKPDHHLFMPIEPDEAKRQRKLWMDKHYGGETHPVDL